MAYLCTLMSSQLALLICSIVFVTSSHAYGDSVVLDKLSLLCVMYSAVFTLQKAVLLYITANVTWKSYLSRIQETVMAHQIIQAFKNFVAEDKTVINVDYGGYGESLLSLKSVHRAKDIADLGFTEDPGLLYDSVLSSKKLESTPSKTPVYNALMRTLKLSPPRRDCTPMHMVQHSSSLPGPHLTLEHIQTIFGSTAPRVMEILDRNCDGSIDKQEFVILFDEISRSAVNLKETLRDFEKIGATLNRALGGISLIVTTFTALAILGVNLLQNSVLIVSTFVASSIVFGSSLQRFFEGIILVYASKPFEVGDRVQINDMCLLIKNISILTTHAVCADGQYCILSNAQLKDAVIINAYRSSASAQRWSLLVPCTVPPDFCEQLENHLNNMKIEGVDGIDCWYETCRADGLHDLVIISARQNSNFQNVALKAKIGKQVGAGIKSFTSDLEAGHVIVRLGQALHNDEL
ncbi:hypothetical protein JKP88DRAFT_243888 [Tribonema minus]|uniref:EF-hand domain-containing protein n=1 Tax=Tribonema minus TaxID=303371 RepID=A0A836CI32_9STRA|nr:hypothetical protein JKP88DRAFT_243888 [Tribonema minus]